jgi:leucyl aminopeptidase
MKLQVKIGRIEEAVSEAILVFMAENEPLASAEAVDKAMQAALTKEVEKRRFDGKFGKLMNLGSVGEIPAKKIFILGLGEKASLDPGKVQSLFAKVIKFAKEEGIKSLAFSDMADLGFVEAAVEGMTLGAYKFSKYKSAPESEEEEPEVMILVKDARQLVTAKSQLEKGQIYSQATIFARDLVNEPASVTTPAYLASLAGDLAKKRGFSCRVYGQEELEKMGMGAFLGVAKGSDEPAKFIRLDWRHGKKVVVLVGKGITFDSGGLSLKKQEDMETMKMDMAGAAAILAIFSVIDKISPKVHLVGLIPATENMPSGKALKPGDIVKVFNGKTVEVVNTDAEGRLILADALSYGVSLKPEVLIDIATLTGACIVALGEEIAGLFCEDEKLANSLKKSACQVGEKFWPMPLEKGYQELLKSEIADIKNVSGKRYAGAITAALFLQEFVNKKPWVHLDIAGPAWQEKGVDLIARGGSGFGVRTILNFLESQ